MKKFLFSLLITMSFLIVSAPQVLAAEVELLSEYDTTVKQSAPDTSFETASSLDMLYDSGTDPNAAPQDVHESLLKFDLSSLPAGKYITSAKLKVAATGASTFGYSDVRLRRILSAWGKEVTWSTRPTYAGDSEANLEISQNAFPSEVTITELVREWYKGTLPNRGFALRSFGDGDYKKGLFTGEDAHISSKEGASSPRLVISYSDTPPPSASPSTSPSAKSTSAATSSSSSSGTGNPGTGSQPGSKSNASSSGDLSSGFIEQSVSPCLDSLSNMKVRYNDITAELSFSSAVPESAKLYYYMVSKINQSGEKGQNAVNYSTDATELKEATASRSHQFVLASLSPHVTYYYTLIVGGSQECEHNFTTLQSVLGSQGPSVLSGASKGLSETERTSVQMEGSLSRLVQTISRTWRFVTGGQPLGVMGFLAVLLSLVFPFTLGLPTYKSFKKTYSAFRNLPHLWLAFSQKKKKRETWGRVISSQTLKGVPSALISLYEDGSNKLIDRTLSDSRGLYGFLVSPGLYRVVAQHGAYTFPPRLMPYAYQGAIFKVENLQGIVQMDIAMDPADISNPIFGRLETTSYWLQGFRLPIIAIGLAASVWTMLATSTILHGLLILIFGAAAILECKRQRLAHYQLTLKNQQGDTLCLAQVKLKNKRNQIVLRKLSNTTGKLIVAVPAGDYTMEVTSLPIESRTNATQATQPITLERSLLLKPLTVIVPIS